MKINQAGLELVKESEGFRARAYICPAGKQTIGYGHVILPGEEYLKTSTISEAHGEELLQHDLVIAEKAVAKLISVTLNPNQFSALCSFTFNLGVRQLKGSTLRRLLNRGDYASVPAQLNRWVYSGKQVLPGLKVRRAAEGQLFNLALSGEEACHCSCHQ